MNSLRRQHGFTVIELLVSLFIFIIAVTIVSSVFAQALRVQRRAMNFQQVEESTSFILEALAKEIRVSVIPAPATPGCSGTLALRHPVHGDIGYGLVGTNLVRTTPAGGPQIVNSNTVRFYRLMFCRQGTAAGDGQQGRVTIVAGVQSVEITEQAKLDLQTTVTLRFYDDEGKTPF